MQSLEAIKFSSSILKEARSRLGRQFQQLEELDILDNSELGLTIGALNICPMCKYESKKNPRGSAKLFRTEYGGLLKCFSCGIRRVVKL